MLKSVTVKDYMSANLVTFSPNQDILRAINELIESRISGAPVVDERGKLVGMLTEKDCLRVALSASYHGESGGRVKEYMHPEIKTVEHDMSIVDVAAMFLNDEYRIYPVVQENRLVGQISRRDVLKALEALW